MSVWNLPARIGSRSLFRGSRRTFGGNDLVPFERESRSSATGDEFRLIKRQIVNRTMSDTGTGRDPRIILVTSALPGEGKTFVALHLAMSLAQERGASVTLIDCNVDDSDSRFSDSGGYGLLDCLENPSAGADRALSNSSIPNIKILPLGRVGDDAADLIGGSGMGMLLNGLVSKSNNSFVVVDTGAVLAGGAAVALAQHAGQIVFVIEKDRTRRTEVEESLSLLDRVGGAINERWVGFVFNKADPSESLARHRT